MSQSIRTSSCRAGILALLLTAAVAGCRSATVTVILQEQTVAGKSALRVLNNSDYTTRVFFDDAYIGAVSRDSARQWRVPDGNHAVKVETAEVKSEPLVKNYDFVAGNVWTCAVSWDDISEGASASGRLKPAE